MTKMTGPGCAVMCNLINTHTHTHTYIQCKWHRMTRMIGPDCAVMCNLINTLPCGIFKKSGKNVSHFLEERKKCQPCGDGISPSSKMICTALYTLLYLMGVVRRVEASIELLSDILTSLYIYLCPVDPYRTI